jgi:hypothetical protein
MSDLNPDGTLLDEPSVTTKIAAAIDEVLIKDAVPAAA